MLASVLVVNLYCPEYPAVAAVRVTRILPLPLIVPAAPPLLITTDDDGDNTDPDPTLIVPDTLMFVVIQTVSLLFDTVRFVNDVVAVPPTVWPPVPDNVTVPVDGV
jgi:hypothetical protein